jgi:hypothetical protein
VIDRKAPCPSDAEEVQLNYCLHLAQAWGEYWLKPINKRLKIARPDLSDGEVARLNDIACETMNEGYDLVYSLVEQCKFENSDETKLNFVAALLQRFPWIDDDNQSHLFSTGYYYAMK